MDEHRYKVGESIHWRWGGEGPITKGTVLETILDENGQLAYKVELPKPTYGFYDEPSAAIEVIEAFTISEEQAFKERMMQSYGQAERRRF